MTLIKPAVCVGPSLNLSDQIANSHFSFHPPISDGDLVKLVDSGVRMIGIVDGFFKDRLAIQHKEILWAMAEGVTVLGAASMGALRAAELDTFGMVGCGRIYRSYRRGDLTDDAAVALDHGPAITGFRPLTIPLVDFFATAEALQMRGRLTREATERLKTCAVATHYSIRTWIKVADEFTQCPSEVTQFAAMLQSAHVEAKRLDALRLLKLMSGAKKPCDRVAKPFIPPMTPAFARTLARARDSITK